MIAPWGWGKHEMKAEGGDKQTMTQDALRARPVWFTAPDGVGEEVIRNLVRTFYGRVRTDDFIGPIFRRVIGADLEPHLAKLCDFWSSVALGTGRYKGAPMQAHLKMDGLAPEHFAHWLGLFRETAREVCSPDAAEFFIGRAERIAQSLQAALFFRIEKQPSHKASLPGAAAGPAGEAPR